MLRAPKDLVVFSPKFFRELEVVVDRCKAEEIERDSAFLARISEEPIPCEVDGCLPRGTPEDDGVDDMLQMIDLQEYLFKV